MPGPPVPRAPSAANVYHPGLRDYPFLAFALLSAAAVCCGLGSYKLTLDVPGARGMENSWAPWGPHNIFINFLPYAGCSVFFLKVGMHVSSCS